MDKGNTEKVTVENTRDMRYGEIFIIKESGLDVYNTTGLNDCPAELWDALDTETVKKDFGAMQVQKNGPHFWMMDEQVGHQQGSTFPTLSPSTSRQQWLCQI